jgi:hypothetical protein
MSEMAGSFHTISKRVAVRVELRANLGLGILEIRRNRLRDHFLQ